MNPDWKTTDFNYHLPEHLIAQHPLANRSSSRLLCVDIARDNLVHSQVSALVDWVRPNDLLIFNDTKVIPARLWGHKLTGGKVECLV